MVFFVITRKGFEDYLSVAEKLPAPLWISTGILNTSELEALRCRGADVTDFNYEIGLSESKVIADAIETIRQHHPGEVIWVGR